MPLNNIKMSTSKHSDSASNSNMSNNGFRRNDSAGSLGSCGFPHNDSANSLSSLALSDEENFLDITSKNKSVRGRRPTPPQSAIFLRRSLEGFEDQETVNEMENASKNSDRLLQKMNNLQGDITSVEDIENSEEVAEAGHITDWVTIPILVEVLAYYPSLRTTLLKLWEKYKLKPNSVRDTVLCNNNIFNLNGEMVELRPDITICLQHVSDDGCEDESSCQDLHICPQYLARNCSEEDCPLSHKWNTHHNSKIIGPSGFYLNTLPLEILHNVIECAITCPSPTGNLNICKSYNDSSCKRRYCKYLHICKYYIAGRAHCYKLLCQLNHSFSEPSVIYLLEIHGFSDKESPKDIVNSLLEYSPSIADNLPPFPPIEPEEFPVTVWANYSCGDVEIAEICHNSVNGICEYERSGCKRLHCQQYFHWQVKTPEGHWLNMIRSLVYCLEVAYCDPQQGSVTLPYHDQNTLDPSASDLYPLMGHKIWVANFDEPDKITMSSGEDTLELRRLHSEDIGEPVKGCEFAWYYQENNGKFIEYGTAGSTEEDDMSDTTSQDLEKVFQNYLKEGQKIHFSNTRFTYYLDITVMTQVNQCNDTNRKVRRRPRPHF